MWKIALYLKGTSRTTARERQKHGLRTSEGKDPMPYPAYVHLAKALSMSDKPEHTAAHLFLLLEWNMVSRSEAVVDQHIDLFGVYNDALLVHLGPSKGDQDGSKHADHPWHIYSVPQEPAICPVLAFSKYLVTHPHVLTGDCKVFDGSSQYERFNTIMREIVRSDEHAATFVSLGIKPEFFGTHSLRKGAITFAACGVTVSPPIASICIRANWKMPGVMNRYIRFEAVGDQYVGRSVSGRDRLTEDFAESCPYFDFSQYEPS
ncbi:hypothetical protein ACHAWO_011295 [Cyclotella atomus]|uniref:Tyr recombinase domain-containing protein n=1 Tax=Cyclotella atomus TaxID=382360 RepID=A0ABD3N1C4_9STRA